jgi:soluble lytic murein transglycosylase-like protein
MIYGGRTLGRIGLAAIVVGAVPVSLLSQENLFSQQARSATNQPFAGYDASLTGAADALLASASLTPTEANGQTGKTASASLAILYGPQLRSGSGAPSLAAARVDLLRSAVEPILRSHGVPTDLIAVILVESGGRTDALSPKGARGLWQLMPDTARRYGLRVDDIQDDRLDPFKATEAAARYLHDLFVQFGDWKLALAAYNTGEANVASAILRAHTQDFDRLASLWMLPLETRNYVPRVLAAAPSVGQLSVFETGHHGSDTTTVYAASSR